MAKLDRKVTEPLARSLPAPSGKQQEIYWCAEKPGFGVRVTAGGARTWILEKRIAGKTVRRALGPISGRGAMSVEVARKKFKEVSNQLELGIDALARQRDDKARHVADLKAAKARQHYTVQALCTEYCDWLEKRQKSSHRNARGILQKHLIDAHPQTASTVAAEVTRAQLLEAIRKLTDGGQNATARKLRAYLQAAYACAARADSDPTVPAAFLAFGVATNPVTPIKAIATRADKNPLPLPELRRYWQQLCEESGAIGAALRLHVLTGGQRVAQLARLQASDIMAGALVLEDPKGKRHEPRKHLVPITPGVAAELKKLPSAGYVLSLDGGERPMHPTNLSAWASDIGKRAGLEGFQLKRVRSGVETALAQAGVPLHVRGQLQSHGLSGVQERHYDAHTYLPEKHRALVKLYALLKGEERVKVVQMRAGR